MVIDPFVLRKAITRELRLAGFNTSQLTNDMWLAVAKALVLEFGSGSNGPQWIEITVDPTIPPGIFQGLTDTNPGQPWPKETMAWQLTSVGGNIVALWFNDQGGAMTWERVWPAVATGDHKVALNSADDLANSYDYLQYKLEAGSHVTISQDGTKLKIDAAWPTIPFVPGPYPGPMTPVGTDYAGDPSDPRYALGTHSHPVPDPVVEGGKLYPSRVPDPNNRGMCVCAFLGPHFARGDTPMLTGFTEISPGVREYPTTGPIPAAWLDGVDPDVSTPGHQSSLVGKMVYVYYQGDTSLLGDEEPLQGPYIIDDIGLHWEFIGGGWFGVSTKARLRRAPGYTIGTDFVQGMTFQLQTGNSYGTGFLTLTTPQPITLGTTNLGVSFSAGPTYSWTYTYPLLTGAQLVTQGADDTDDTSTWSMAGGSAGAPESFITLPGIPGVTKIPAGAGLFQFGQVQATAAAIDGVTKLRARVILAGADGATIIADNILTPEVVLTVNGPPMLVQIPYDLASDITWSAPDYRLVLVPTLVTTNSTPVTITLRYSSSNRDTWWRSTMVFPTLGGTNDHLALLNTSQDVKAGETPDHPDKAIHIEGPFTGNLTGLVGLDQAMEVLDSLGLPNTIIKSLFVSATELALDGADIKSHTMLGPLHQRTDSIQLPKSGIDGVSFIFQLPFDKIGTSSPTIRPLWSPGSTGSGSVCWAVAWQTVTGSDITVVEAVIPWVGDSPGFTSNVPYRETGYVIGPYSPAAGTFIRIELQRIGTDVTDTYAGAVNLLGVEVNYIGRI